MSIDKFDKIIEQTKRLEENVVSSLADSSSDVEIILKELLVYLNATSSGLSQIQQQIEFIREPIKDLDEILIRTKNSEGLIENLPRESQRLIEEQNKMISDSIKQMSLPIKNFIAKLSDHVSNLTKLIKYQSQRIEKNKDSIEKIVDSIDYLNKNLETMKKDILSSQSGLYKVIDALIQNRTAIDKASINVQSDSAKSTLDLQKHKMNFWLKIIGYVLGSGGLIYFVVDIIMRSA